MLAFTITVKGIRIIRTNDATEIFRSTACLTTVIAWKTFQTVVPKLDWARTLGSLNKSYFSYAFPAVIYSSIETKYTVLMTV